jgi:dephospho-CoA kinase
MSELELLPVLLAAGVSAVLAAAALRATIASVPGEDRRWRERPPLGWRLVWPLVRQAERAFLAAARRRGARIAVLDIPLLLETGGEKRVDEVIVVSAPAAVQRSRVLARGSMSPGQFAAIDCTPPMRFTR